MKDVYRILIAGVVAVVSLGAIASAQTVVVGANDPDIDIAAVQTAVDHGGSVVLRGHFSFDNPAIRRGSLPDLMAMILVSNEVSISGTWDERGEMTTIHGGEIPFAVEARGAAIRIEGLRFVRPKRYAIFVNAVSGLEIESCTIENVDPLPPPGDPTGMSYGFGIYVSTLLGLPTAERPGKPENVSGKLSIRNNQISVSGSADEGMGIMIVSVGDPGNPVELDISGNTIRNATQKGINLKQIGGRARIERNIVTSSLVYTGPARGLIAGIHCGGSGSYLIAGNRIEMADPDGAGIRLRAFQNDAIVGATITDNDVTMSAHEGAVLGPHSAGIEIRGLARNNTARRNRIQGRGRVGLSVASDNTGTPADNNFDRNDHENLISPLTDGGKQK